MDAARVQELRDTISDVGQFVPLHEEIDSDCNGRAFDFIVTRYHDDREGYAASP